MTRADATMYMCMHAIIYACLWAYQYVYAYGYSFSDTDMRIYICDLSWLRPSDAQMRQ